MGLMTPQTHDPLPRLILIPKDASLAESGAVPHTLRAVAAAVRAANASRPTVRGLHVVDRSRPDGAVLVEPGGLTVDDVKAVAPDMKVFEEQWYELERFDLMLPRLARSRSKAGAGAERLWTVVVRADGAPLKDVRITAVVDADTGVVTEAVTDRHGRAALKLGARVTGVQALHVDPLHGAWPVMLPDVDARGEVFEVALPPIVASAADARGLVYGKPKAGAGRRVTVAVVDTGVGRHDLLRVAGGRNTTGESPRRLSDWHGHGTHVAGVIAARANGWRRGEAASATLRAYRVFAEQADHASTFAISTAIKQAAVDGCDLINLSLGGGPADGAIRDAVDQAWQLGCVCVAAAGNDGRGQVDYPARYPRTLAVSAIGLDGSWPEGASQALHRGRARGKAIDGREVFLATFSNRGAKVALTAPGVGIVSTIFNNRWGVMDGTSMAAPVATGVLARRLAATPAVRDLPRDAARSEAIVALARAHAEDVGLPRELQGDGLAR
ncbi:hypothetical protein A4W93_22145 [Piscinibacter gummiphilus]|uniref:Peptidase S8/S53 domain-containing protein n=2 Tax=Piscinibacter gummiphilus TaxID=946333 RepID=A0A1W6LDT4_9BURK|nr:hypothetical protein A4W93_22145 [Piscinibacter gummiphilus]